MIIDPRAFCHSLLADNVLNLLLFVQLLCITMPTSFNASSLMDGDSTIIKPSVDWQALVVKL